MGRGLPWWSSRLRIHLAMQGVRVQSLVWEHPETWGATKPVCRNCWACELWSPHAATIEDLKPEWKIPHVTTKTRCSNVNEDIFLKEKTVSRKKRKVRENRNIRTGKKKTILTYFTILPSIEYTTKIYPHPHPYGKIPGLEAEVQNTGGNCFILIWPSLETYRPTSWEMVRFPDLH